MKKVKEIIQTTNNRFLNMFNFKSVTKSGKEMTYFVASRAEKAEDLKINQNEITSDAAIIYAICKEDKEKLVVIRQYRYSIDDYIYELPAGLIDKGETLEEAAKRELKEETGLDLEITPCAPYMNKPFFTSVGLSDECCATVYGYASGIINNDGQEDSEEIEVLLMDREAVKKVLNEGNVALPAGYMMLHFVSSEEGHALDFVVNSNK